jgi:hypothetical protein
LRPAILIFRSCPEQEPSQGLTTIVVAGLGPAIHAEIGLAAIIARFQWPHGSMDARVKPAHDE